MRGDNFLTHEFVEFIPDELMERTIYISIDCATISHKCCCGCGNEVVTPLSPTDWRLIFDGKTISLEPSIGNWGYDCQSHYWVTHNRVEWAAQFSKDKIDAVRRYDRDLKQTYFNSVDTAAYSSLSNAAKTKQADEKPLNIWQKFKNWLLS